MKTLTLLLAAVAPLLATAQTPARIHASLPRLPEWKLSDKIETFNPDNLFDRINGAAPLYIENNFREMTTTEYTRADAYITIQVYRHATPEDAFGMYAAERTSGLAHYPIGGEAQGDNESLAFFVDSLYVKLWSNGDDNAGNVIREIATAFALRVNPRAAYPDILRRFPPLHKQPYSETYTTSNYLGHEFLEKVYSARYLRDDRPYQLFVIVSDTPEQARAILERYFTFTKQPLSFQEGPLTVNDRYNGVIPILWQGSRVVGLFPENGPPPPRAAELLRSLADQL